MTEKSVPLNLPIAGAFALSLIGCGGANTKLPLDAAGRGGSGASCAGAGGAGGAGGGGAVAGGAAPPGPAPAGLARVPVAGARVAPGPVAKAEAAQLRGARAAQAAGGAGSGRMAPLISSLFPVGPDGPLDGRLITMPCNEDSANGTDCSAAGLYYRGDGTLLVARVVKKFHRTDARRFLCTKAGLATILGRWKRARDWQERRGCAR